MALPTTAGSELTATTVARKWKIDVDVSPAQDGTDWRRLMGQTDCTVNPGTAGLQADSDYDSDGFTSQTATTQEWGFTATVRRGPRRASPTQYDPAQEFLRGRSRGTGPDNTAHIRAYEYSGPSGPQVEAYEGFVAVAWANSGGGPDALSSATITGTGQGALLPIAHPAGTAVAAPTVTGVRYDGGATSVPAAGGTLLAIDGANLATVTTVVVFGNTVPGNDWFPVTGNILAVRAPAHAAGTGDVVVTGPGGTSGTSAATKVVYV